MARLGLDAVIEEMVENGEIEVEQKSPLDARLLKMLYPSMFGFFVARNELEYDDWEIKVERLKSTEPDHAAALEEWGELHFGGVVGEMLEKSLEQRRMREAASDPQRAHRLMNVASDLIRRGVYLMGGR